MQEGADGIKEIIEGDVWAPIKEFLNLGLHLGEGEKSIHLTVGKVFEIKLRTTRAITRDDKVIVVPNHKFISDIIHNYTQNHRTTRESVSIGVAYGSDVNLVTQLLEEVAHEQKRVLKNPKPFVLFDDFGDSALLFSLHFFTNDSFADPKIKSDIRYSINAKFQENNISIPFPQRDVHIIQDQKPLK